MKTPYVKPPTKLHLTRFFHYISKSTMDLKESTVAVQVMTVDVHEAKHLLNQAGHLYLDVRTEEEFRNGHVENALNIPYMFTTPNGRLKNPKFIDQVLAICRKEDQLVVGCQSGARSEYATTDLLDSGFKHVVNMGGGYTAWIGNGFAVKKPNPN